jgi:hypothetical protein
MTEVHGGSARTHEEFVRLMRKAEKGDRTVLPALQEEFDNYPALWQELGDLARTARDSLIRCLAGEKNAAMQEVYDRKLTAMQQELAGPTTSPLERLLVERIVLCWLHLYYAEALYAQNMQDLSLRQAAFYQQRLSKAQARYLSAIRTLAQVRRLGVPAVQVNIGQQQVIAG